MIDNLTSYDRIMYSTLMCCHPYNFLCYVMNFKLALKQVSMCLEIFNLNFASVLKHALQLAFSFSFYVGQSCHSLLYNLLSCIKHVN